MEIQHTNFGNNAIIRCGTHEGKYDYGAHIHQFCELVWIIDGELEMTVDGRREVCRKDDIVVITPFQVHAFNTPYYCKIWICVLSDYFAETHTHDEIYLSRTSSVLKPSRALLDHLAAADFRKMCLDLRDHLNDRSYLHLLRSFFYLILAEYVSKTPPLGSGIRANTLSRILVYMSDHFKENINQSSVGKALGYSPRYISNCFDAIPAMNFRSMLNSLRVEYAKNLLINTDFGITSIALESGFSGERSFHRAFLSIVGVTPGEYRKSKKG